ncbi:MAG TPA: hypothetical protein VHV10_17875 [Ktedonobacteraceae bacterium]|jgi:hypothetical protein|nr:hypothetical protein [Ktedonobacteraceae bacterium]
MATIKNIQDLSDTGILVVAALEAVKTEESPAEWKRAAEIYSLYKLEIADQMIDEELGFEYTLDVETCREWLMGEQEWNEAEEAREDAKYDVSTLSLLDAIES